MAISLLREHRQLFVCGSAMIGIGSGGTLEGAGAIKDNLADLGGTVEAVGGVLSISGSITGTRQILIGGWLQRRISMR